MCSTCRLHVYALSIGSNRPLSTQRTPAWLLEEAAAMIGRVGTVVAMAPIAATRPIGPSQRLFANSALLLETPLMPDSMLETMQRIERTLGRRRYRRWGARSMDIDIILWSAGRWRSRGLSIPHPGFRLRAFVLNPLNAIAPGWRDPVSGLTVRQLRARLGKARPVPNRSQGGAGR